jgi:hypothetical protein
MPETEDQPRKVIHHNVPQLTYNIVKPKTFVGKMGRGTGKTYGALADFLADNAIAMPGSVGAIGTDSYKHLRTIILGEIEKKWKARGLERNRDYWFEKFPPEHLQVPSPIRPITDPKNCFFFRNGSALKTYSFNFNSLANGDSIDYMGVEEAKMVKQHRFGEASRCIRGNDEFFGHLSCHGSLMLITDSPGADEPEGHWVHNWDDMHQDDMVNLIINISYFEQQKRKEAKACGDQKRKKKLLIELTALQEKLNHWRKRCVMVMEVSTVQNLHAVGYEALKGYIRSDNIEKLKTSVFSIRPKSFAEGFYGFLDSDKHGYVAIADKHLTRTGKFIDDCRSDTDIDHSQPLSVCLDYNNTITCVAVGQRDGNEIKLLKNLWVESPKKVKHAAQAFCNYYKYHANKEVNYAFDNTAIGTDAIRSEDETYKAEFIRVLEANGWVVYDERYPQTSHHYRYDKWGAILSEDQNQPFRFSYNMENCREWAVAAKRTTVKIKTNFKGEKKLEKDKSSESHKLKGRIPPIEQTHITEAVDGLLIYLTEVYNNYSYVMPIG